MTPPRYIWYDGFMKLNASLGQIFPCSLVTINNNLKTYKTSLYVNNMYVVDVKGEKERFVQAREVITSACTIRKSLSNL